MFVDIRAATVPNKKWFDPVDVNPAKVAYIEPHEADNEVFYRVVFSSSSVDLYTNSAGRKAILTAE